MIEKKILIVEDSKAMLMLEKDTIERELNFQTSLARSLKETKEVISKEGAKSFFIALLDLNLPDAQNGEVVDLVLSYNIPVIVFTGTYSSEIREKIMQKDIIDYVLKSDVSNFNFVVNLISYIQKNIGKKALVVDDSKLSRLYVKSLLTMQKFEVYEANDGEEAFTILEQNDDIELIITDKEMPVMNGIELVKKVRQKHTSEEIVIIGMSTLNDTLTTVEFLKHGANDFILKPFTEEEFLYRVMQTMRMLEYIKSAREHAIKDTLTGLYNRRHLYSEGIRLFNEAKKGDIKISLAMFDIDNFKNINDTYGHNCGDKALSSLASLMLEKISKKDIAVRFGGEEFLIILVNCDNPVELLNDIREDVSKMEHLAKDDTFKFSVSIGVTDNLSNSLDDMIAGADSNLYYAKKHGKNQVKSD